MLYTSFSIYIGIKSRSRLLHQRKGPFGPTYPGHLFDRSLQVMAAPAPWATVPISCNCPISFGKIRLYLFPFPPPLPRQRVADHATHGQKQTSYQPTGCQLTLSLATFACSGRSQRGWLQPRRRARNNPSPSPSPCHTPTPLHPLPLPTLPRVQRHLPLASDSLSGPVPRKGSSQTPCYWHQVTDEWT